MGFALHLGPWQQDKRGALAKEPILERTASFSGLVSKSRSTVAKALIILLFCRYFRSGGTRTRTGDTMIFSLGRYVSSRFCQLQNPPKQAESLRCAFPDVSHRCFGLVSKLVSNGHWCFIRHYAKQRLPRL